MGTAVIILLGAQQQRFPSPSPPKKGGEGRGGEAVFFQFPLSPALSPLVPRGERGKNALGVFHAEHNTIGETPAATPLNTYGDVSSRRTRAAPGIDRPACSDSSRR